MKFLWTENVENDAARYVWRNTPESKNVAPEVVPQTEVDENLTKLDAKSDAAIDTKEMREQLELEQKMQPIIDKYQELIQAAAEKELSGDWSHLNLAQQFEKMTGFEEMHKKSLWESAVSYDKHNLEVAMTVGIITAAGRDHPVEIPWTTNKETGGNRAFHGGWAKLAHGAFWGALAGGVFGNPAVMRIASSTLRGLGEVGKVGAGAIIHSINDPGSAIDAISDSFSSGSFEDVEDFARTGRSRDENAHDALEASTNPWELRKHFEYAPSVNGVLDEIAQFQSHPEAYRNTPYAQEKLLAMIPNAAQVVAQLSKNTFSENDLWAFQAAVQRTEGVEHGDAEKLLSTAATSGIMGFFASQSPEIREQFIEQVLEQFRSGNPGGDLSNTPMVLTSPEDLKKIADTPEKQGIEGVLSDGLSTNVLKLFAGVYALINVLFTGRDFVVGAAGKTVEFVKKAPERTWKVLKLPKTAWLALRGKLKDSKTFESALEDLGEKMDPPVSKKQMKKLYKELSKKERDDLRTDLLKESEINGEIDLPSVAILRDKIKKLDGLGSD